MNRYDFEELEVGHEEKFSVTVTPDMLRKFQEITGDVNPLHTDPLFAEKQGYSSCVAYGMLTASFYPPWRESIFPGKRA